MERRKIIEIAFAVIILAGSCLVLTLFGRANRVMLPSAKLERIAQPHEAFREWGKYGVHGRILVLMDRYLNAEPDERGTFEYSPDEFKDGYSPEKLCSAIRDDDYGISRLSSPCTISELNAFLRTQDFYPAWQLRKKGIIVPMEVLNKLREVRGRAHRFEDLPKEWKQNVIEFNRVLLDLTYPGISPEKTAWSFVTPDNYVYRAIREGYVRKIYHVVPDAAWQEVEAKLRQYPAVTFSAGTFSMAIENFTPVIILRLRDLPALSEEVLLNVNSAYLSPGELDGLAIKIRTGSMRSDLVTVSGPAAGKVLERLGGQQ